VRRRPTADNPWLFESTPEWSLYDTISLRAQGSASAPDASLRAKFKQAHCGIRSYHQDVRTERASDYVRKIYAEIRPAIMRRAVAFQSHIHRLTTHHARDGRTNVHAGQISKDFIQARMMFNAPSSQIPGLKRLCNTLAQDFLVIRGQTRLHTLVASV